MWITVRSALTSGLLVTLLGMPLQGNPPVEQELGPASEEGSGAGTPMDPSTPVSFVKQIRPLLSDRCFACHGPDEKTRAADLRLDVREAALDGGAIVAGDPDASELVRRISLDKDDDERMPPVEFHKDLSEQEIQLIRDWIAQGAVYLPHWSYRPLERPEIPGIESIAGVAIADAARIKNPIDAFILSTLDQQGLTFNEPADKITLIRRLYLDLVGMPPRPDEVTAFLEDVSSGAIDRVVESLLLDPRFGERLAVYWLDLVRYADTIGYHSDNFMEVSAYRDYVIRSFNENKAFNQFTIEQLAGDLLPDPSEEQLIASGYNRLLQTTEEGGAQAKEYTAIYAADRVRNLSGVWMGQTVGCAQCHDHKYDPFTIHDFYSLSAFFADIVEVAAGRRNPNYTFVSPAEQKELDRLTEKVAALQIDQRLSSEPELTRKLVEGQAAWEQSRLQLLHSEASSQETSKPDSVRDAGDGKGVSRKERSEEKASIPKPVAAALGVPAQDRSSQEFELLAQHYRSIAPELATAKLQLEEAEKELTAFRSSLQTMLISKSLSEPRVARILPRGNWLDDSGEIVQPATPSFLPHEAIEGGRATRLDLAHWIVAEDNPLTTRTFVNRMWKLFHGRGLSRNLDDLGGQGEAPTHPELLDWLAVEFLESGWDIKHLVRLMVTSTTYAQSSQVTSIGRAKDPLNLLFGRQGRWRLEAEFIRDAALSISGLLVTETIGGRSVKPYQPAGYWQHLNFPQREWEADSGNDLYRRGLYTFWCRTFLHPSLLAFDAPSREECTAERSRSNIPQQALVLLNDPIFVEAAHGFAKRILHSSEETDERLTWAIRTAMSRDPLPQELEILRSLLESQLDRYAGAHEDAHALLQVGTAAEIGQDDPAELAAWTQVSRAILNAYETTSRF